MNINARCHYCGIVIYMQFYIICIMSILFSAFVHAKCSYYLVHCMPREGSTYQPIARSKPSTDDTLVLANTIQILHTQ